MTTDFWARLKAPFSPDALTWRLVESSNDGHQARFRPQLSRKAIVDRLNEVAGTSGWSNSFHPVGGSALCCNLAIQGVTRSVVCDVPDNASAATISDDALARAAEQFEMRAPLQADPEDWVDIDPQTSLPLYPPALMKQADDSPASEPASEKSAGQQAIDRLVERLKVEGRGLDAARLLVEYGGYGSSPERGRELYARLRALLKGEAVGDA